MGFNNKWPATIGPHYYSNLLVSFMLFTLRSWFDVPVATSDSSIRYPRVNSASQKHIAIVVRCKVHLQHVLKIQSALKWERIQWMVWKLQDCVHKLAFQQLCWLELLGAKGWSFFTIGHKSCDPKVKSILQGPLPHLPTLISSVLLLKHCDPQAKLFSWWAGIWRRMQWRVPRCLHNSSLA